jgi:hypothetical protein
MIRIILAAGIVFFSIFGCLLQLDAQEEPPLRKREVPVITFKNLSPPYKEYEYFRGIKEYDFQFEATTFSLINAWWLAEISTLVFADEEFVRSRLKKVGLPEVTFFDKRSTQCYVANNDRFAVIAFRGSDIWTKKEKFNMKKVVGDLKADLDIRLTGWQQGGKVHRGFKEALYEVWPDLQPYIIRFESKGYRIWITGHSLGGALATLCGSLLNNAQGVYTFGSPRVGNKEFKEHLSVRIYRIVNNADIVCRVPLKHKYVHVGELKFIDRDGIIGDDMGEYLRPIDQLDGDPYEQQVDTHHSERSSFRGFVPPPFRDHVPTLYGVHLWNNLIERRAR